MPGWAIDIMLEVLARTSEAPGSVHRIVSGSFSADGPLLCMEGQPCRLSLC